MDFPEFADGMWPLLTGAKRPSRYVGCEYGTLPEKGGERPVWMCLAFPDTYEIGMSYLGFQILYFLVKSLPYADVDRVYCPWPDLEELLRARSLPLSSIENGRPVGQFDLVGFTLQYELSYTNVLTMLDLAGIPLLSEERGEKDPLICAGGPGALTPEPLAPFVDFFCLGDGEELLAEVLKVLSETKGATRQDRLSALSEVEGVYVPAFVDYCPHPDEGGRFLWKRSNKDVPLFQRRAVQCLDSAFSPEMLLVPSAGIVHDRIPIELFRGCTRGCRFCQAGMVTRPVRERSPDSLVERARLLVDRTGWEELGLLSLASCDYSHVVPLIRSLTSALADRNVKISLPSLRMDAFSVLLAAEMESMRREGLTFAPEAGTQRLRDVINKGVTEEDFDVCLETALSKGWDRIKLYFMMGLPGETDKDLEGIVDLAERAFAIGRRNRKKPRIALSVAGFVPKAHTPFQWERQSTVEELRAKGRFLKGLAMSRQGGKNNRLSLKYHEPEQTVLEGVFARGDRALAPVLLEAWRRGARFDGWSETFSYDLWMDAFDRTGIDPARYAHRQRTKNEGLPWDHIAAGVSKSFLWREKEKADRGLLSPDCRPHGVDQGATCHGCGAVACPLAPGQRG